MGNETWTPLFYLPNLLAEADIGPRPYMDILIDVGGDEHGDAYQVKIESFILFPLDFRIFIYLSDGR